MVDQHSKKKTITASKPNINPEQKQGTTTREKHTAIKIDENDSQSGYDINPGNKRMGGPTGEGANRGDSATGKKHRADDSTADHYGSREETNAALEDKIAIQNTLKLHEHF